MMKIRKFKKHFPDLYEWISTLIYPKKFRGYIKVDYVDINKKNITNNQRESQAQIKLFSLKNVYTFHIRKPCPDCPDGWISLYQQITFEKKKKNVINNVELAEGDYSMYLMNKCNELITQLEGGRGPIKTVVSPKKYP